MAPVRAACDLEQCISAQAVFVGSSTTQAEWSERSLTQDLQAAQLAARVLERSVLSNEHKAPAQRMRLAALRGE